MEDARYWFPCHDYPDHFLTSSVTATVPEDWTVISNGILEKVTADRKDKAKTFQWVEANRMLSTSFRLRQENIPSSMIIMVRLQFIIMYLLTTLNMQKKTSQTCRIF